MRNLKKLPNLYLEDLTKIDWTDYVRTSFLNLLTIYFNSLRKEATVKLGYDFLNPNEIINSFFTWRGLFMATVEESPAEGLISKEMVFSICSTLVKHLQFATFSGIISLEEMK